MQRRVCSACPCLSLQDSLVDSGNILSVFEDQDVSYATLEEDTMEPSIKDFQNMARREREQNMRLGHGEDTFSSLKQGVQNVVVDFDSPFYES